MQKKTRKYGRVELAPQLIIDESSNAHIINKSKEGNKIWVEKFEDPIFSTTGSGGADLYNYRQIRRFERTSEYYKKVEEEKLEKINLILENEKRVNNILDKKREKNRQKRIKKKLAKRKWKKKTLKKEKLENKIEKAQVDENTQKQLSNEIIMKKKLEKNIEKEKFIKKNENEKLEENINLDEKIKLSKIL